MIAERHEATAESLAAIRDGGPPRAPARHGAARAALPRGLLRDPRPGACLGRAPRSAGSGWRRLPPASAASPSPTASCRPAARPGSGSRAPGALLPLLLAGAVIATGGPTSPALMWFALPAVTLGARFEPWGMAVGTAYLLAVFLISTVAVDPASAAAHSQTLVAAVALILSTVILSGALVESDRAHRRRSTLDPLTGLFNRNALEQRLAELDGQPEQRARTASRTPCCSATSITSSGSTTSSATPPATRCCRTSPTRCGRCCGPATRSTGSAARRSSSSCPGASESDAVGSRRAPAAGGAQAAPGRGGGDDQHRRRRLQARGGRHRRPRRPGRRRALLAPRPAAATTVFVGATDASVSG